MHFDTRDKYIQLQLKPPIRRKLDIIFRYYVLPSEMHEPPYYRDYSSARLLVHSVVTSKYFDLAIAAVIGLNVVTMALEFYMMPKVSFYTRAIPIC